VSGTLQLPDSCFSLFYKLAKDGDAARFVGDPSNFVSLGNRRAFADILVADTSTLPMLLPMNWNYSSKLVNRLLLA